MNHNTNEPSCSIKIRIYNIYKKLLSPRRNASGDRERNSTHNYNNNFMNPDITKAQTRMYKIVDAGPILNAREAIKN
jgi:hypothetical protein